MQARSSPEKPTGHGFRSWHCAPDAGVTREHHPGAWPWLVALRGGRLCGHCRVHTVLVLPVPRARRAAASWRPGWGPDGTPSPGSFLRLAAKARPPPWALAPCTPLCFMGPWQQRRVSDAVWLCALFAFTKSDKTIPYFKETGPQSHARAQQVGFPGSRGPGGAWTCPPQPLAWAFLISGAFLFPGFAGDSRQECGWVLRPVTGGWCWTPRVSLSVCSWCRWTEEGAS